MGNKQTRKETETISFDETEVGKRWLEEQKFRENELKKEEEMGKLYDSVSTSELFFEGNRLCPSYSYGKEHRINLRVDLIFMLLVKSFETLKEKILEERKLTLQGDAEIYQKIKELDERIMYLEAKSDFEDKAKQQELLNK